MLKHNTADFHHSNLAGKDYNFVRLIQLTKQHFETEQNRQEYLSLWRKTTLLHIITENPGKTRKGYLELLFDNLLKVQCGLSVVYQEEHSLRDQILNACQGIPGCKMTLMKPAPTYEGVCADL